MTLVMNNKKEDFKITGNNSYCISHSYSHICHAILVIPHVTSVRVIASMSQRGGEDTSCVRLGTGSRRKAEENVFLQRDCIQSLKTVISDMNSLHGLSSVTQANVMQQRRLASRYGPSKAHRQVRVPPIIIIRGPYLRCHKAWLLQVCRRGSFAPPSLESMG